VVKKFAGGVQHVRASGGPGDLGQFLVGLDHMWHGSDRLRWPHGTAYGGIGQPPTTKTLHGHGPTVATLLNWPFTFTRSTTSQHSGGIGQVSAPPCHQMIWHSWRTPAKLAQAKPQPVYLCTVHCPLSAVRCPTVQVAPVEHLCLSSRQSLASILHFSDKTPAMTARATNAQSYQGHPITHLPSACTFHT